MIFLVTSAITAGVLLRLMLEDVSALNTHDARAKRERLLADHSEALKGFAKAIRSLGLDAPPYMGQREDRVVFSRKGRRAYPDS